MTMDGEATACVRTYIEGLHDSRRGEYANARTVKMMASSITQNVRLRTCDSRQAANTVAAADVKGFVWTGLPDERPRIGFNKQK
jgi:hypothetical protein